MFNSNFNYAPFVTLAVFILGLLFTPVLRNWEFFLASKKKKRLLFAELKDCRIYLEEIISIYFRLLATLESSKDENDNVGKIPIPLIQNFDLNFIIEFYKESLLLLTQEQRLFLREVPAQLKMIKDYSETFNNAVLNEKFYNTRNIRNIIWLSCHLHSELGQLLKMKKKYNRTKSKDSIEVTKETLISLNYSEADIESAKVLKSMLTDLERSNFSGKSSFQVPD